MEQLIPTDSAPNLSPTLPQLPPKKSKVRKIIMIVLLIIVTPPLFLYISWIILLATAKDGPPPDDKDLQLEMVNVSEKDNAAFDLIKASNALFLSENDDGFIIAVINSNEWDEKKVKTLLDKNSEAISYFEEAYKKPGYQNPELAKAGSITTITTYVTLPPLNLFRKVARLSIAKSKYSFAHGSEQQALEEAIRVTEIGQKMEGPQSALIEYLVGMGIKSIGIREAINIIQTTKLLNNELLPYYAQLEKFKQNEEGLEKILKGDYQMFSWIIDQAVKGITDGQHIPLRGLESLNPSEVKYLQKHSYFFEPNNTKKIYAEETRKQLKNVEKPCGQISKPNRKYLTPRNSFIKFMLTENVIGKILRDVTFVSFDGIFPKKCQEDFLVSTAQTLIAIKAYHNDTNAFPNSLTELVPKYLSKVPEDPFSGGQLRYSKDKKIIYSVGLNLTDVGGSNSKDWNSLYQDDDPTIKIDF